MDKKIKKRITALKRRLEKLRLKLAGAKQQADDHKEVAMYEEAVKAAEAELKRLKEA